MSKELDIFQIIKEQERIFKENENLDIFNFDPPKRILPLIVGRDIQSGELSNPQAAIAYVYPDRQVIRYNDGTEIEFFKSSEKQ